ncbi:S-layer homology domain-containing protein [Aminipila terrae]|uniref:SLH domain-containing protein n=1 Tax=Aminipila terrae TaxID=2697030 RepID=A0A6P1MFY5_9FIRM|nr:S-layer homology domain-containing protein [Aminipila terrae]QHI72093.1 hypothetical protein Ami3637_06480 [Aminipila terrae]
MKKVLSFVLILALVLSSFSMAFAGQSTEIKSLSDISGNTNQSAIEVAYDLGIVTGNPDGTFQPAKAVTRAEFAAMITRALAVPQSALAGYANATFKDTNGYAWAVPYLAFCNSKGIMLGDGAGNAMPGKTITVNEAVTMALRAVGYTANSAELTGVWPSNYVTKAQELKLYDDVAKDATGVDKANAAQIIYNTLSVDKVSVNSDGKTENVKKDGSNVSLLTSGLNCTEEKNVILTSAMIDDSIICAAKYLGQHGNLYKNDDDEIVAFIAKDCEQIVGRFVPDGSTGVKFTTTNDEKDYSLATNSTNTSAGALILENGRQDANKTLSTTLDQSHIASGLSTPEYVLSGDISGKTIKTVYSVNRWVANNSDQISASDVAQIKDDHSLLNSDFVEDDNDAIDYTQFQLVGVNSLSDIKADNVVYVFADKDGIRRIEVGTQTVEGTVKNFKNAKTDLLTKFAIGANTYRNAAEAENSINGGSKVESGNVSDDVKAFLDARGYVYDFTNTTTANNYAVVEKVSNSSSIKDEAKLMLADGTEKTFTFDSDADKAGALQSGTVIGYGLDKSGEVTDSNRNYIAASNIKLSSSKVISSITTLPGAYSAYRNSNVSTSTAIKNTRIADNCVVFTYKTTTSGSIQTDTQATNAGKTLVPNTAYRDATGSYVYIDDYDVTTIDKVDVDKEISGAGVILLMDEENNGDAKIDKVVAMFLPDTSAKSGTKSYAVINDLNKDANTDGDKVFHVVGFIDGKKVDTYTDDWSTSFFGSYKDVVYQNNLGTARLYQVKVDAKGVITDATYFGAGVNALDNDTDLKSTAELTVKDADGHDSIVTTETGNPRYALAKNATIYQVTKDDEYKTYTGDFQAGDKVILYETNDDNDGYDIAIFVRFK